jgi:hypothetical protein
MEEVLRFEFWGLSFASCSPLLSSSSSIFGAGGISRLVLSIMVFFPIPEPLLPYSREIEGEDENDKKG